MPASKPTRTALILTATVLAALVVGLGSVELFLRVTGLAQPAGIGTVTVSEFNQIPGIFGPRQDAVDREIPQLVHRVSINSLGYRGAEVSSIKADGEFRIFFSGDSFSFGSYVDNDATLPAQLGRILGEQCPGITVINGGVGGSTITEEEHMIRRAMVLRPDLVVLMFYDNDIEDLSQKPLWESLSENRKRKSEFPLSLAYRTFRDTAIWDLLVRAKARTQRRDTVHKDRSLVGSEAHTKLQELYATRLSQVSEYLHQQNVKFVFAVFPSHHTFSSDHPTGTACGVEDLIWVTNLARSMKLTTVNILSPLRKTGLKVEELYLLPYDGHASPRAYRIGAEAIAERIRTANLVPRASCVGKPR